MNVLFLSNEFPTPDDPLRAVFNRHMVRGLARRHRVRVVCPIAWTDAIGPRRALAPTDAAEPFSTRFPRFYFPPRVALHRRGTWMWWSLRRELLRDARHHRPDIVLSYWAHPDGEVAWSLARRIGVPVALMVGGSDVLVLTSDPRRRERIVAVLRGVDAVLTVGEHLRDHVVAMGVPASRVTSVMRPVDSTRFFPGDRATARHRLGLPSDHVILLAVGRLVPGKAIDMLLRAVALLREHHPRMVVCIAGEGSEARRLSALCDRLHIDNLVRWLGAVPHEALPDWYRAADVTVLPSRSEGVPNVLLESIACGTPFVASRVGSIPDIADDACDRLVPPDDANGLAAGIDDVLARRGTPTTRSHMPAGEPAFQARLDEALGRCLAAAAPTSPTRSPLRAATQINPSGWRQLARRALVGASPRRWLVGAGKPTSRAVCLTFDDGPHEIVTPRLLDVLRSEGVRATFFVRGDQASLRPELVRRMVDEGHLLGHHSWSHGVPGETSARELLNEVRRTRAWLRGQIGVDSTWFRPPNGKITVTKLLGLWAAGQTIALWNVDPGDVFRHHPQEIADWFATNSLRGGDVVLLHDTSMATVEALPALIARTRAAGVEFTTLDHFGGPPRRVAERTR